MGKTMKLNNNVIRPRRYVSRLNSLNAAGHNSTAMEDLQHIFKITTSSDGNIIKRHHKPHQHGTKAALEYPEKKTVSERILGELESYCDQSTLHGLRYVGNRSLTIGERLFWLAAFSVAVGFSVSFIMKVYEKWNSNPVIISFSPYDAELSSLPFPSVTICNMNQAKRTEAETILANGSSVEKKLLNDVCNGNEEYPDSEQYSWLTLKDFLIRVGSPCTEMLKMCEWSQELQPCSELFNNYLTDEGLCCSFNRLPPNITFRNPHEISVLNQTYTTDIYDWDPEKGFSEAPSGDNVTPKRPLGAGAHLGLTVVLDAQVDNYYCSSTNSVGFKIVLANPIETPKMADFGTLVSPGVEARFSITPSVKDASDSLRHLAIEKRRCYFANERRLMYYRSYTQRNCILECQSNYTYRKCNCLPYYLPKTSDVKFCGKKEQTCVGDAKEEIETKADIRNTVAVAHFFFLNSKYSKIIKSEIFGFTDILSNTGGLLGLFMGFSIMSIIEIIYFLTVRVWCTTYKNRELRKVIFNRNVINNQPFFE